MGNLLSTSTEQQLRPYNRLSNEGIVFNLDLSRRSDLGVRRDDNNTGLVLTQEEVDERRAWEESKSDIQMGLDRVNLLKPGEKNTEDLLRLQVAAPVLHTDPSRVSTRSAIAEAQANRSRPPQLSAWENFEQLVASFVIPNDKLRLEGASRVKAGKKVMLSFDDDHPLTDEIGEQLYLGRTAMASLAQARLIGSMVDGNKGLVANPDFWLSSERQEIVVVGETKSTHNLPLPMAAGDVVQQYNDEFANRSANPSEDQIRVWSHVGHPLSQLIGYMILNRCRFGLLTSATRTYFVRILENQHREDVVFVSNAWFIGQRSYLRAIAAFYHLASNDTSPRLGRQNRRGWAIATPPGMKQARSRKRPRDGEDPGRAYTRSRGRLGDDGAMGEPRSGGSQANAEMVLANPVGSSPIESVQFDEIDLTSPLGYGKQGTSFRAQWREETVAVKIFDATKPGGQEAFDKELTAYTHLRDAWGELVPFPKFVSSAFEFVFWGCRWRIHLRFMPKAKTGQMSWICLRKSIVSVILMYGQGRGAMTGGI